MLKVIGERECSCVQVEADPWIPLTVTWSMASSKQPLYWRISGSNGGEVEVKVDPMHGTLFEIIVIDSPPAGIIEDKLRPGWGEVIVHPGLAVIDCSPWGVVENPDYSEFASRIITSTEELSFTSTLTEASLFVSRKPTVCVLECDGVQVHVAEDGALVGVTARY